MIDINNIVNMIKADQAKKQNKYEARQFYYYKPKEVGETTDTYQNGMIHEFRNKKCEIYTNYFKVLVNQKIDYILAKEVAIETDMPEEFNIQDILETALLNSSLDCVSWLHLYINDDGLLDWILISDVEILPIYDRYNKYIVQIVRYYKDNKDIKAEIWAKDGVSFVTIRDSQLVDVVSKTHYLVESVYNGTPEDIQYFNFGFVPFMPLFNNKGKESDMQDLKPLLTMYNSISSGFIDNINQFQEALMKLKGYGGTDLEAFKEQLKKYKVIPIDEGGDFEYVKVEIPVEARSVILEILKQNIFLIGRGVNPDQIGDGNITNIVIKNRYAGLDMKCNDAEKQMKLFYRQLINAINTYYRANIDYDDITFNRIQVFNETEQIDNVVKSSGLISERTLLANHPWVSNVDGELKLMEEDKANTATMLNLDNPIMSDNSNNNDNSNIPPNNGGGNSGQ
jgi:SPP1 family phage portal protein